MERLLIVTSSKICCLFANLYREVMKKKTVLDTFFVKGTQKTLELTGRINKDFVS